MRHNEPPCEFGACRNIRFINGTFSFESQGVELWGEGSWIDDDYGTHIEGLLLVPTLRNGAPIIIDIIENPAYGIYTVRHPQVRLFRGWRSLLVAQHRTNRYETHRAEHLLANEQLLTVNLHQRGVLQLRRAGETNWGPRRFTGREVNAGLVTVYL